MNKLSKVLSVGVLIGLGASTANAAVTFSETTGFSGDLDLKFFYSSVPLVVTAIVAVMAVGIAIKLLRKAH